MSKAKFAAAKELIAEKRYDEARGILRTIDHPTAQKWLGKLDEIDPPFPLISAPPSKFPPLTATSVSAEQEEYYTRENRRARRKAIGNGINLVVIGIVCFVIFAFFAMPRIDLQTGAKVIDPGLGYLFLPIGLIAVVTGVRRIRGKSATR